MDSRETKDTPPSSESPPIQAPPREPCYDHDPFVQYQSGAFLSLLVLAAVVVCVVPRGAGAFLCFLLGFITLAVYVSATIDRGRWRREVERLWLEDYVAAVEQASRNGLLSEMLDSGQIAAEYRTLREKSSSKEVPKPRAGALSWTQWQHLDPDAPPPPYRERLAKYLGVAESEVLVPEPRPQSKMAFWCLVPISRGVTLKSIEYLRQVLHRIHHAVHGDGRSASQR